jgi:predicted nucleic acid-binding OB-fold protein
MRPSTREFDAADAIAARVEAFRELKNIVDEKVLREIEGGGSNPVFGLFVQVRRVLSF